MICMGNDEPELDEDTKKLLFDGSKGIVDVSSDDIGEIIIEGPRAFICARCGKPFKEGEAFHCKPETYAFRVDGKLFYLERHLHDECRLIDYPAPNPKAVLL